MPQEKLIDFSFIPSLKCNLNCPFCMYDCDMEQKEILDIEKTEKFISTIDWSMINSCGFYGGEISINMPVFQWFIDMIPEDVPRFCISNGSWTTISNELMWEFVAFLTHNKMFLVVSGTPHHKKYQDVHKLQMLKDAYPDGMRLKGDDIIHPMGRAKKDDWTCTNKCQTYEVPTRLGLFPNGDVLFQNCDGIYPFVIQAYDEPFDGIMDRVKEAVEKCPRRI
jgi:hypothetical protein